MKTWKQSKMTNRRPNPVRVRVKTPARRANKIAALPPEKTNWCQYSGPTRLDPFTEPARQPGEQGPIFSDQAVGPFSEVGQRRRFFVTTQRPLPVGIARQRAENGLRTGINQAVGFDELDGSVKLPAGNFGKLRCNVRVLGGQVVHAVAGHLLPAADPQRAEIAVAVKNQQRLGRRRGDADATLHDSTLNQRRHGMQPARRRGGGIESSRPGQFLVDKSEIWE